MKLLMLYTTRNRGSMFLGSFFRSNLPLARCRATGCYVRPTKFQAKLEQQLTKMAAQKHEITVMVNHCGASDLKEVKKKPAPKIVEKTPKGRLDDDLAERHRDAEKEPLPKWPNDQNPHTGEKGGPAGPEPTRFGDWERKGRVSDF